MEVTRGGGCYKRWQGNSFVSDNSRESITENEFAQLDESDSIQKSKWIETT